MQKPNNHQGISEHLKLYDEKRIAVGRAIQEGEVSPELAATAYGVNIEKIQECVRLYEEQAGADAEVDGRL